MIKKVTNKKRLGIFLCYDSVGIIDDYIPYLLNGIKGSLSDLIIVVNGVLTPGGRNKLEKITTNLVVRENKGLDAGAWKFAMTEYFGWDRTLEYDEVLLFNDSFFGPIFPFEDVFFEMDNRHVDFWGLTKHGNSENSFGNNLHGCFPEHIQSYFTVIGSRMLHSFEFQEYWSKLPDFKTLAELIEKHETVFTKYFSDLGFTWDTYIYTDDLDRGGPYNHYAHDTCTLLERGYPVIKRKGFAQSSSASLLATNGEEYAKAIEFIKTHSSYNIDLAFQNVLRNYNIADIHDALHLDYVLSSATMEKPGLQINETAVVLHITYTEKLERYLRYIKEIPQEIDVIITTISDEKRKLINAAFGAILGNRLSIIVMENRGRDLAALLVAAKPLLLKYRFFCLCHDKISVQAPYAIGNSFERILWENTLSTKEYIYNVLKLFEDNATLGVLGTPPPLSGAGLLFLLNSQWWGPNFDNTKELLKRLGISVSISAARPPLTIGTAFWCRTDALRPLLDYDWKYSDFPAEPMDTDGQLNHALERSFAYVAQSAGYYTGVAMTPEYASVFVNDYKFLAMNPEYFLTKEAMLSRVDLSLIGVRNAYNLLITTLKLYFKKKSNQRKQKK